MLHVLMTKVIHGDIERFFKNQGFHAVCYIGTIDNAAIGTDIVLFFFE